MKELQVKGAADGKLSIALNGDIDSGNADEFYAANRGSSVKVIGSK